MTWCRNLLARVMSIEILTKFHGWMTVFWTVMIVPDMLWLANSLPFINFISMWALLATHWGAYQAGRAERLTKQQIVPQLHDVAEDIEDISEDQA